MTLEAVLREEIAAAEDFAEAIAAEQKLLVTGQIDELGSCVEAKNAIAAQLGMLAEKRDALQAASGFGSGRDGMQAWLGSLSPEDEAAQLWKALLALAENIRAENEINGKLVQNLLRQNRQALAVLSGQGTTPLAYGRDGQQFVSPAERPGGRSFGQA